MGALEILGAQPGGSRGRPAEDALSILGEETPAPTLLQSIYGVNQALGKVPDPRALPAIGGTVGGLAGSIPSGPGPLTIAGAAGGGALGRFAQQALTPGAALDPRQIAMSGGEQGAYELAGGLAAAGVSKLAKPLMRSALRPTAKAMERATEQLAGQAARLRDKGLPKDLVEVVLEQGGKVGGKGLEMAKAARREAAAATKQLYEQATRAGRKFPIQEIVGRHLGELWDEFDLLGDKPALRTLQRMTRTFAESTQKIAKGSKLTPLHLERIVKLMQKRMEPVLKAVGGGGVPSDVQNVKARVWAALGKAGREMLDEIPGVAAAESNTQRRIMAQRALRRAENIPPPQIRPGIAQSVAYNFRTIGGLANDPFLASRLALIAANPYLANVFAQGARGIGTGAQAVNQQMQEQ